jgi:hypothetical protein
MVEQHEHDEWREAHPEAALAEAISVAIGCILQHELNETKRAAAINTLIEAESACGVRARAAAALRERRAKQWPPPRPRP